MKKIKLVPLLVLALLGFLTIGISEPIRIKIKEEPKKVNRTKLGNCCSLGVVHGNKVKINSICSDKTTTTFELEFMENSNVCTILENVTLVDNFGKKYNPKGYSGIASCPESNSVRIGEKFYWSFEPIDTKAKSFSLSEVELEKATGLNAWQWRDVNLSHCDWK